MSKPRCRLCGAELSLTFVDLGMSREREYAPVGEGHKRRVPLASGLLDVETGCHLGSALGDELARDLPLLGRWIEEIGIAQSDKVSRWMDAASSPVPGSARGKDPAINQLRMSRAEEVAVAGQPGHGRDGMAGAVEQAGVVDVEDQEQEQEQEQDAT